MPLSKKYLDFVTAQVAAGATIEIAEGECLLRTKGLNPMCFVHVDVIEHCKKVLVMDSKTVGVSTVWSCIF